MEEILTEMPKQISALGWRDPGSDYLSGLP